MTSSLGRHALANGDSASALVWFERSHAGFFSRDLYLSEAQIYIRNKDEDKAALALDQYAQRNSEDPRLWKLRGELMVRTGKESDAVKAFEKAYSLGRYTDLGIMRNLLEAVQRAQMGEHYRSRKIEFDKLFTDYADAIEHNAHFIALSSNVEELQMVSRVLSKLYPNDEQRYKEIARSAVAHAREERSKFESRTSGILW